MKERCKFLDVHKIFSNRAIQGSFAGVGITYREENLDAIARAYLDDGEGKIEGLSGLNVEAQPPEKQLEYCLQDAQLCLKLIQKNDYELFRILYYIGKEVGLDLVETANASGPIAWWTSKLKSMKYARATGYTAKWMNEYTIKDRNGKKCNPWYAGGQVLDPVPGQHHNVLTFDVSSMYPTMSHVHNISSESICCECCKDNPAARIPTEVMNDINERLKNEGKEPRPWYYWICKLRTGKLGEVMKDLIEKKIEFKRQKMKFKEKAVKLLINSGYGTFSNPYFPFYDVRVSELITAFARYTLGSIRNSLMKKGCKIVYGDTDSLFVTVDEGNTSLTTDKIISEAKNKYGVLFELKTTWKILLLTDKQKTYLGLTDRDEVDGTSMLGKRSNKPKFFHDVTNYLISKQSLKRIIDEGVEAALNQVMEYVKNAYLQLEDRIKSCDLKFIREKLAYYEASKKPIYEQLNGWHSDIYNEILKEECGGDEPLAKSKCYEGRVYQIWKVESMSGRKKENAYSMHPERHLLNLEKYKEELWIGVRDMFLFYGLDENRIEDLKNELVK
jgi:DNA polymerase elongation subunit (family B)